MKRDASLMYGADVPLAEILAHTSFRAHSRTGVELRRAAARALNEALFDAGLTRRSLARRTQMDYDVLTKICIGKQGMNVDALKDALHCLGRDWRTQQVRFAHALDYPARAPFG